MLDDYLPQRVNVGPWITAFTLNELRTRTDTDFVLPICSLDTPYRDCVGLGEILLPPLYHEAMTGELKQAIVARIRECFPSFTENNSNRLRVVEFAKNPLPESTSSSVLAFSVDTAVEEHGPHLPLGTDTIQSYSVLRQLASDYPDIELARPLDYGQLTWGLPFGFSVDLTAELLVPYVSGYVNAIAQWKRPDCIYVVDVHGSITHRSAIVDGLTASEYSQWAFRWLHEPLAEFASQRGDQHAGGVETALVERENANLLDRRWWPDRIDEIASGQMSFQTAVDLTHDLDAFVRHVDEHSANGVIGDIRNYESLDADEMFERMMRVARADIDQLRRGSATQTAGKDLW